MRKNLDKFKIGNKQFDSRLMLGTGKYRTIKDTVDSIVSSECEIITVAIRRLPINLKNDHTSFLNSLNWKKLWLLPNTAGSQTAEEAIRMAFLGHELACQLGQPDNFFIKLEVISDPKYLLPDPIGTLKAAEFLVKKGFTVLPYINADPMLALHLEDLGCATVMPLGSPIGSGQGINNLTNIKNYFNKYIFISIQDFHQGHYDKLFYTNKDLKHYLKKHPDKRSHKKIVKKDKVYKIFLRNFK